MSPVDRAGSVTEMKLVSVHMVTFSPLFRDEKFEKVVTRPFRREIQRTSLARISRFSLFKQPQISFDLTLTIK